jgi:hypothetical protein
MSEKIELTPGDLETLVWGAVHYGLGRRSCYPSDICLLVARLAPSLRPPTRAMIARHIAEAQRRKELGMDMDAQQWLALKRLLEESG